VAKRSAPNGAADARTPAPADPLAALDTSPLVGWPLGLYVADAAGRLLFANPMSRELLGLPASGPLDGRIGDFLAEAVPGGPFELAFDRGCLHTLDEAAARARFAEAPAGLLVPGGLWLSLIGSTEGPPRDVGPPRRSARDVVAAIEPALEVVELRATVVDLNHAPHQRHNIRLGDGAGVGVHAG